MTVEKIGGGVLDTKQIVKDLQEQGVCVIQAPSNVMWPMIKKETDVLVFESVRQTSQLEKGDVLLYLTEEGELAISRLHNREGQEYVLNQDTSLDFDKVYRKELLGRLTTYYRKGKEKAMDDSSYQTYLYAWVYPWRLRFTLIAIVLIIPLAWQWLIKSIKTFFGQ